MVTKYPKSSLTEPFTNQGNETERDDEQVNISGERQSETHQFATISHTEGISSDKGVIKPANIRQKNLDTELYQIDDVDAVDFNSSKEF